MGFGINFFFFGFRLDTAFIASRGGWLYCDDSRVSQANSKEVVVSCGLYSICLPVSPFIDRLSSFVILQGKPAYVLYYKRVKS